jgi:hypothetical protein
MPKLRAEFREKSGLTSQSKEKHVAKFRIDKNTEDRSKISVRSDVSIEFLALINISRNFSQSAKPEL